MRINKSSIDKKTMDLAKELVQFYYDFDYYDFVDAYGVDEEDFDRANFDMYDSLINDKQMVLSELDEMIEELGYDTRDYPDIAIMYGDAVKLRERVESL